MSGIGIPYGYRAKLGLVVVGPNPTPREDVGRMVPTGVLVLETRVAMEPRVELDVIHQLSEKLPEAARVLSESRCDVIAVACTAGTVTGGPGHDRKEIEEMEGGTDGVPCTTVATAVHNALQWMGVKRIVLASPYLDNINEDFVRFYNNTGFEVMNVKGMGVTSSHELSTVPADKIYKLAREVNTSEAEGIFIPCTTFPAIDTIDELEKDTGKVVITSNQALAWEMLRLAGIDEPVEGYGALLSKRNRCKFENGS